MKDFIAISRLGFKQFFRPGKSIVMAVLVLVTVLITVNGILDYRNISAKSRHFQELDASQTKMLNNYLHYSFRGVKFLFFPGPLGKFLINKETTAELSGRVDSVTSLDITINAKSDAIFEEPRYSPFRYTFIVLLLGTLFVLFIGVNFPQNREFQQFIASQTGHFKVFACRVLTTLLFFALVLLCLFFVILLTFGVFRTPLSGPDISALAGYFFAAWCMLVFFFFIGAVIGSIRKRKYAVYTLLTVWFISIFLVPAVLNSYVSNQAGAIITSYRVEYEQLKIVKDFEKKAEEMYGKYDGNKKEIGKQVAEYYYNEVYPRIEALENEFRNRIAAVIRKKQNLSIWFPTTFLQLTGSTAGGCSHREYLKFYTFLQEKKKAFLRFWIDHVYYDDSKELVSFIDETGSNIFHAGAGLPGNFHTGILVNLFYCVILFLVSYFRYRRVLFPAWKSAGSEDQLKIQLFNDEKVTVNTYQTCIASQIVNIFFGVFKNFKAAVQIEETSIVTRKKKEFLYLPHPSLLPGDLKPIELFTFFKRIWKLTAAEFEGLKKTVETKILHDYFGNIGTLAGAQLLLSLVELGKCPVYIFHDFAAGLEMKDRSQLADRLDAFHKKNSLVIDINTTKDRWLNADSTVTVGLVDSKYKTLKSANASLNGGD